MKSFKVMAKDLNTNTETHVATCVRASDAARLAYNHNTKNGFDPTNTYVVKRSTK